LGIREIKEQDIQDILEITGSVGIYIIPSHGKGPRIYDIVKEKKGTVIDAVCPLVTRALDKARQARDEGYHILIYGDENHDEVAGYKAWLGEDCRIIGGWEEDYTGADLPVKLALMAQTTADEEEYHRLAHRLKAAGRDPLVLDTICSETKERQAAVESVAV
jgi:4-hydroxy-3-methylbut-2-enyl diphosphate reductase